MSTPVQRAGAALPNDLMTRLGTAAAEYADGVLTVSIPTTEPVAPQVIPVTHRELPVE